MTFENINQLTDFKDCGGEINISVFKSENRSWLPYFVYLPPNWSADKEYPLVIFFHGQGGDEGTFGKYVNAEQVNGWILNDEIEPLVIVGVRGDNERDEVQWFTKENEALFTGENGGEFVQFCQDNFNAGFDKKKISIEGHSRGAAGAINYFLKYPNQFASIVGMGYVSDYTLEENYMLAKKNLGQLIQGKTPLRLEIGTEDSFVRNKQRKASCKMHQFLEENTIAHSFEVLHGVEHGFDTFWNYYTEEGMLNGLAHLKFHEKARNSKNV